MKYIFSLGALLLTMNAITQNDPLNGEWKSRYIIKKNTTEAEFMIRAGDIDNLGFGFPKAYDPFSGKATDPHQYPLQRTDKTEPLGYDLVMLGSSYKDENNARDGYSAARGYLMKNFGKTNFEIKIPMKDVDSSKIKNVTLQLFVDDFQAKEFGTKFEFYINGTRYSPGDKLLNALHQTGPIGKLITLPVTKDRVNEFKKDTVRILIDDQTTGLGDGYAIDFIKVLVNPTGIKTGTISGVVYNVEGNPIEGVIVSSGNSVSLKTKSDGKFTLSGIPAGHAILHVQGSGVKDEDFGVDVEANNKNSVELRYEEKTQEGEN